MTEENTQNINEVVVKKEKNPKRVEQGKKLAEWNRKNKKTALEVPLVQEVSTQDVHAPEEPTQDVLAQKYWILGGTLAIIGVLYFNNRESVPQQVQEKALPKKCLIHQLLILLLWIKKKKLYI